jgi:rapamycin-insensitive companion of mTOR
MPSLLRKSVSVSCGSKECSLNVTYVLIVDPIYNMLDNYAGIICCSFIHVQLFRHLTWLCANGDIYISTRCRDMIVDLMGVVSKVCTERVCSDLLTLPSLLQDAASASSMQHPDKAYKASDLLMALSDAFSVTKSDGSLSNQTDSEERSHSSASSSRGAKRLSAARNFEAGGLLGKKGMASAKGLSCIADELVQTSLVSGTDISSKKGEMAHDLKAFINTAVDRAEFSRQMDMSRILGKEGKEPFRWDWSVINELLDYSLRNPERLAESLKTKFIKRISGFYRCSVEEKGYFANLEWEPTHIHILECACNLYCILVDSETGMNFLNADRRGMVFAEIIRDLEAVITSAAAMKAASQGVSFSPHTYNFSGLSRTSGINVFRPSGCVHTMSREYFCLIGRLSHTPQGRQLLNSCQTYDHLSRLGHYVSLDYLSRVALTALGFTDGGFMSKDLLQIYTTSGATSDNLRLYCHTLLRALLRSRSKEFCEWGMSLMVEQLIFPHVPRRSIIRCPSPTLSTNNT